MDLFMVVVFLFLYIFQKITLELGIFKNKVYTVNDEILGMPGPVFMGGLAVCGVVFVFSHIIFSVIFALMYFPVMGIIYKDNPRALSAWVRFLMCRKRYWAAGVRKKPFRVYFY
jgi:hypothetical protein